MYEHQGFTRSDFPTPLKIGSRNLKASFEIPNFHPRCRLAETV
jgi:hypothetical protein